MRHFKSFLGFILILGFLSCNNSEKKASAEKDKHDKQMEQIVKLYESQKWAEIIPSEDFLLKQSETDANSLLILADSFAQLGNYEKGISYAEKIVAKDPSNYYALLMLGNYHNMIEQYDSAENYYLEVLEIKPTYARANLNLAMMYEKLNKNEQAILQYLKAIELFHQNSFNKEVIQYSQAVLKLDSKNKIAKKYLDDKINIP